MSKPHTDSGVQTAEHLKAAALRLFAEHGVNAVTVRQIADAAGQKNHAIVGYYFGSKDDLIRAVIIHGARMIDDYRNDMFDALEASDEPATIASITACLVRSALPPASEPWSTCFNRFLSSLSLTNRPLLMGALDGRWNSGFLRGLGHIRQLLAHLPPHIVSQRLVFFEASLGGLLVARERALADETRPHLTWTDDATLDHLAQGLAAMLEAPSP